MINYSDLIVSKIGPRYNTVVNWSNYNAPIIPVDGIAGNSRRWGDASATVQIEAINALIEASQNYGLTDYQTAYVLAIAREESGFNPDAAAGTTSASGLKLR